MSAARLTQGPVTSDVDQRIANLIMAWTFAASTGDPYAADYIWALRNWQHAREALTYIVKFHNEDDVFSVATDGLEVVGE